jgi:hypothetical protein
MGEAAVDQPLTLTVTAAGPEPLERVELIAFFPPKASATGDRPRRGRRPQRETMAFKNISGFEYTLEIPAEKMNAGMVRYYIAIQGADTSLTWPGGIKGQPSDWDYYGESWNTRVVNPDAPMMLFNAADDMRRVTSQSRWRGVQTVMSDIPGTSAMAMQTQNLEREPHDMTVRYFFKESVKGRRTDLAKAENIRFFGKSLNDKACLLQVAVLDSDGIAFGASVEVQPENSIYSVPVSALKQVRSVNAPRGYPWFLPYWFSTEKDIACDMSRVEGLQLSIGPGIPEDQYANPQGVQLERIWME